MTARTDVRISASTIGSRGAIDEARTVEATTYAPHVMIASAIVRIVRDFVR